MSRTGSISDMIEEVGFPGVPEDKLETTSPTSNEIAKDELQKKDEFFDRTDLVYSVFVKMFNCSDSKDATAWGDLTTKFMNSKLPKKPGDPPLFLRLKQETSFTKDGMYIIAVQWSECTRVAVKDEFEGEDKNESQSNSI